MKTVVPLAAKLWPRVVSVSVLESRQERSVIGQEVD